MGGAIGQAGAFLLARYLVRDWVVEYVAHKWSKVRNEGGQTLSASLPHFTQESLPCNGSIAGPSCSPARFVTCHLTPNHSPVMGGRPSMHLHAQHVMVSVRLS